MFWLIKRLLKNSFRSPVSPEQVWLGAAPKPAFLLGPASYQNPQPVGGASARSGENRLARAIFQHSLQIYRSVLSPILAALGAQCRFYPSCSVYWEEALRKHPALKAWRMGLWRLLRCHPFCEGGIDHP